MLNPTTEHTVVFLPIIKLKQSLVKASSHNKLSLQTCLHTKDLNKLECLSPSSIAIFHVYSTFDKRSFTKQMRS